MSYIITSRKIVLTAVTDDITVTLPANTYIQDIIIQNITANTVTLKVGTTSGGTEVISTSISGGNSIETVEYTSYTKRVFSTTATQTLFIQDVAGWNSASLNITILYGQL